MKHWLNLAKWLVVLGIVLLAFWQFGFFTNPVPPDVQVKQASDYCAQLAGYDDGATDDERLAMAVATVNLAKERGASTCDIYKNFAALIGPTKKTVFPWFRETPVMYGTTKVSADRLARFNQTGLLLRKYLQDPSEDLKRFPWLSCATHYMRSTWPGATPYRDHRLRDVMQSVWVSPRKNWLGQQAELFCPREKQSFLPTAPPGISPGGFFI